MTALRSTAFHIAAALCFPALPGQAEVTVRCASVPGAKVPEQIVLSLDEDGGSIPIPLGGPGFSQDLKLPRMEIWRFGHREETGTKEFREIGSVAPPAGKRAWLVFVRSENEATGDEAQEDHEEEDREPDEDVETETGGGAKPAETDWNRELKVSYQVRAFDVDASKLDGGEALVLNLAETPIQIQVGDEETEIEPGREAVVKMSPDAGRSQPVKFYFTFNDRKRSFVTTNWSVGKDRRRLAVVAKQNGTPTPKVTVIDEVSRNPE